MYTVCYVQVNRIRACLYWLYFTSIFFPNKQEELEKHKAKDSSEPAPTFAKAM